MKILKEKDINTLKCPKCNRALIWEDNEYINDGRKILWIQFVKKSGNSWYTCIHCDKQYLIKDALVNNEVKKE